MKSSVYTTIVAFWMCCALDPDLNAQPVIAESPYRFQHFLPSEWTRSIAQDSLGFIWTHGAARLYRFDSYNFKVFKHDPDDTLKSLPRGSIGGIVSDPSGNIWVTVWTGGFPLVKYDAKTDGFIRYESDVKWEFVRVFRFDKTKPIIWFGTEGKGLYSFNFQTLETKSYFNNLPDSLIRAKSNSILTISDRDSSILIASQEGLWQFDKETKTFSRPACNAADSAVFYHASNLRIDEGQNNDPNYVWFWLEGNLLKADKNLSIVQRVDFPDEVYSIDSDRDKEGIFWVATSNGLYRFDPKDNSFINIRAIPGDPNSLKTNMLLYVLIDRDQNIWLGTFNGISRLQKPKLRFFNFNLPGLEESTAYHAGDKEYVIVSKVRNGVHEILISPINPEHLDSLNFKPLTTVEGIVHGSWKGKRNFWISVHGQGVVRLPFDSKSEMIIPGQRQILSHNTQNSNTISSNSTSFVWEDDREVLWVGTTDAGLNKIKAGIPYGSDGSVVRYLKMTSVWNVYPEDEKSFWVITGNGVDLFRNDRFEHVVKNKVRALFAYKAADSILYVGADDGLYKGIKQGGQYILSQRPVLQVDQINKIQGDKLGRLWISNQKSIYCYDPNQQIAIEFNEQDGFDHWGTLNPWFKKDQTPSGIMVIPDDHGISLFDPLSLQLNKAKTFPVITDLKVNNQNPVIHGEASTAVEFSIKENITVLDELILDYQHNNFTIEFSAMEMTSPEKNLYRHKLERFDRGWIETDWKNRTATYTNLDAGEYLFKVKASNHHGIWSDQETTLTVTILPPPWKTWWAYSLYGVALFGIFLSWRNYDLKRVRLKHRAEHLSELDTLKTRFFANISHEFRTPITLILGPLRDLYQKTTEGETKTVLGLVIRNGQRLLRLINQLLDLSKLEAGKMTMQVNQTDLVQFLKDIASSYESLATDKRIRFTIHADVPQLDVYLDNDKIEKVIHNILSNAFKFTNENGEVDLFLKEENKHAVIRIRDTGIGIPHHQMDKIFDRFYQVDSSQTRSYEGSGIGMALAKELVELHHGSISVESKEGEGSTFTVRLPLNLKYLDKDMDYSTDFKRKKLVSSEFISDVQATETTTEVISESLPVLLIVEDNTDMRNYIRKTLKEYYTVEESVNGKEGVAKAKDIVPDLIISDVMMPEMDGYQLCELIKNDEVTSHIPVILLTAKADQQSKLRGLEQRADDYLLKPFDADELKLIVRNHIEERQKMRERFSREIMLEPAQISISSQDERFLQKTLALIEEHMEDENFSIEDFSREAGYSRMQFYRKLKALAGQTPSQFVRTIRLKRAAQMLIKKSDNIAQIAYAVGFGNVAYFNKCFKDQFGVTPGHYSETNTSRV